MRITIFNKEKAAENKYDRAIKLFYLIFGVAGLMVFLIVGIINNNPQIWLFAFFGAAAGTAAWGTLTYFIVSLIRKDEPASNKYDNISWAVYVLFFIIATIAFIATGLHYANAKTWLIAFIGAYGAAAVYGTIAKVIINLIRKDK